MFYSGYYREGFAVVAEENRQATGYEVRMLQKFLYVGFNHDIQ